LIDHSNELYIISWLVPESFRVIVSLSAEIQVDFSIYSYTKVVIHNRLLFKPRSTNTTQILIMKIATIKRSTKINCHRQTQKLLKNVLGRKFPLWIKLWEVYSNFIKHTLSFQLHSFYSLKMTQVYWKITIALMNSR